MRRGLSPSRRQAQEAVAAGRILVGGAVAEKSGRLTAPSEAIVVRGPGRRFVSRGGEKLEAALERFGLDVAGRRALDVGASTGGFTDCLLRHGASHVYAVDVGHGQLDASLRADLRVSVHERSNIRTLTPADLAEDDGPFVAVDLVTADVSFISLTTVVPALAPFRTGAADLVLLVKPQFEAGRAEVSRGRGVIRDPAVWRRALDRVASAVAGAGPGIMGIMPSPLTGPAGNVEFLLHARGGAPAGPSSTPALIEAAVGAAALDPAGTRD